jgi:hypothetical protein
MATADRMAASLLALVAQAAQARLEIALVLEVYQPVD